MLVWPLQMSFNESQSFKGIVASVMSGDSLVVRFLEPCPLGTCIVKLNNLEAPRFSAYSQNIEDEPLGFESWNYLRDLCIGKRVLFPKNYKVANFFLHHSNFGRLQVVYGLLYLHDDNNRDVGLSLISEGFVKMRQENTMSKYGQTLWEAQENAKSQGKGIWNANKKVRRIYTQIYPDNILMTREFNAIVENVLNGTTFVLLLLPKLQRIILTLAGCKSPKKVKEDYQSVGYMSYETTLRKFLNRAVNVRICQLKDRKKTDQEEKSNNMFVGCLVGPPDNAIISLIKDGLAYFDQRTADFAPNADLYVQAEEEARKANKNIWKDAPPPQQRPLTNFEGKCVMIRSSSSLLISNGKESRLFYLNSVKVPYYYYNKGGGAESLGFEAREYLRKHYVGQTLNVVHEGAYYHETAHRDYATIYSNNNKVCINEDLCKQGLAKYSEPFYGKPSEQSQKIQAAENEARNKKLGLFADNLPEPLKIVDLCNFSEGNYKNITNNAAQIKGKELVGVIENVSSKCKFHILIPSCGFFILSGLNGIFPYPTNDKYGIECKNYCQEHILQADITITPCDYEFKFNMCFYSNITIRSFYGRLINLAEDLIGNGLTEIHTRHFKNKSVPESYISHQNAAKQENKGVWADKTRHNYELSFDHYEKVKVVAIWNPVDYSVQFLDHQMDIINSELSTKLTPISQEDIKNKKVFVNQCVVARIKNNLYRARIESFDQENTKIQEVKLIDIQQQHKDCSEYYYLPDSLLNIEPQACFVKLAFLDVIPDMPANKNQQNITEIWGMCQDSILYMHLAYEDDNPNVILTDDTSIESGSLNAVILSRKYVKYSDHNVNPSIENVKQIIKSSAPEDEPTPQNPPPEATSEETVNK